ncbi:MAG: S9 family peptidase [Gemmatimonadota bacterium]|nr:S9 family peptidase [Gemmatimonadota bacterium]
MRVPTWRACVATAAAAIAATIAFAPCAAPAQSAKRPMTIDDIMAIKSVGAPDISPDGHQAVFTIGGWEHPNARGDTARGDTHELRSHVWIVATDGSAKPRQLTFGERGESAPQFSPDGGTVAFLAARGTAASGAAPPRPQIWLLRLSGGEAEQLTRVKSGVSAYAWSPDGRSIAFTSADSTTKDEDAKRARRDDAEEYEGDVPYAHPWIVDVATKAAREVAHSPDWTVNGAPAWSPDGSRFTILTRPSTLQRDERRAAFIVEAASGRLTPIGGVPPVQNTPQWSPDGTRLAFTTLVQTHPPHPDGTMEREQRTTHLTIYDVATGAATDLYDPKQFDEDANQVTWPIAGQIFFTAQDRAWQSLYTVVVPDGRRPGPGARYHASNFKGQLVGAVSFSRDGMQVVMTLQSPLAPGDLYFMRLDGMGEKTRLTDANPQLAGIALGETEVITWRSTDGQEVEGILLKPVGYQPGLRVPLLVEPHGGPTGAHNAGFKASWGSPGQFWAGKGWATLYPNPRGSTGYGEKFMRGNILDWGGGDYRDIMTGVDAVIARGVADSTRLAVAGWSYGGYMTSWIVSQTTRFKAARMGAGLTDLVSMYGTTDIPGYLGGFFDGMPDKKNMELWRARSAMTYINQVRTPTLIIHGGQDQRVPIGQPMELFRGMKDRGVPVELWFYPREGHGFSEYYHQVDKMQREYDWISRYTMGTKVVP